MISTLVLVVYLIVIIFCFCAAIWLCASLVHLILGDAPFVPVMDHALKPIVELLDLDDASTFVEVGCGDGKVLVAASVKFPQVRMIGIERNLVPYLLARFKTRNLPNVEIVRQDIFTYDFSAATHLYTYLFPAVMNGLYGRFQSQLQPGTVLISCDFMFSEKYPVRSIDIAPSDKTILAKRLHVYRW